MWRNRPTTPSTGSTRRASAGAAGQVTAAGATSFTYDGRGNLMSDGTETYSYDVENRLTAVSGGGTLDYDPLSRLYQADGSKNLLAFGVEV